MKTLIAGSRSIQGMSTLIKAIKESQFQISSIISGKAQGVDRLGEEIARLYNLPLYAYPAEWELYGKRAGYIRNVTMVEEAEQAIIVWDGQSKGTKHTISLLGKHKVPHHVHIDYGLAKSCKSIE